MKIGPVEIGENVPDMVSACGDVLQALNKPVYDYTKTTTKTSKKGKTTTKTQHLQLTAAEVAALVVVYAVWKYYHPGALLDTIVDAYKAYYAKVYGWSQEHVSEPLWGNAAAAGYLGPEAQRRMGVGIAESSTYTQSGTEDAATQTGFMWANVGTPDKSTGTFNILPRQEERYD